MASVGVRKEDQVDVSIIGVGNVGGALAGSIARAGHQVTLTAQTMERAEEVAGRTGAKAVSSNVEAAAAGDIVILAVPTPALDEVLGELGDALDGKVVVDVTNRVDMEDPASTIDGTSNGERIQARLPGARVVKALNYAFATRQADPVVDGTPVDGFVAGDDEEARSKVLSLVESIGFRPIDAGSLAMGRALEAMASLIISLQVRHGWSWQNGWKLVGPLGSSGQG